MKKPWQKLSASIAYKNPYWQVRCDKVIQPSGQPGKYHFVDLRHFVSVIALSDDDKSVYLSRQWRYPTDCNSWECCQGIMEKNETPLAAAKRELSEEMGLKAMSWKKLGFSYIANGLTNQGFYVFAARRLTSVPKQLEGSEQDMITKKFPLKKIDTFIKNGFIKDAPTIVSFTYLSLNK